MAMTKRFETLDALRGVAALAVVLFHFGEVKLSPALVPHGYLAVDFFFVLSGFVVAYAYETELLGQLSWRAFFVRRMIRLYPLACLGAMMGLAVLLMKWHSYPGKVDPLPRILLSGMLNGLLLPTFFGGNPSHHKIFPGNGPLWTLFFELVINLLWACFGPRMKTWGLIVVTLVSAFVLTLLAAHFHTANIGFDIQTFWGGMARVSFGFTLGVVIHRFQGAYHVPARATLPPILGLALLAAFAYPGTPHSVPVWDLACIFVLLPAVVIIGTAQGSAGRAGRILGELSYPIYVLHFPILLLMSGLHQSVLRKVGLLPLDVFTFTLILILASLANAFYDKPLRALLSRGALHIRKLAVA